MNKRILIFIVLLAMIPITYYVKTKHLYMMNPVDKIVAKNYKRDTTKPLPVPIKEINDDSSFRETVTFADGSVFITKRMYAPETGGQYFVAGNEWEIRYPDLEAKMFRSIVEGDEIPYSTLFMKTDKTNVILSAPGIYERYPGNSIQRAISLEEPVSIIKTQGGFTIQYPLAGEQNLFSEFWIFESPTPFQWDEDIENFLIVNDLVEKGRFSLDGYFYKSYWNYEPTSDHMYFRNPSNFTGRNFLSRSEKSFRQMAYAMIKATLKTQNAKGYFETGPRSEWLYRDFGIEGNFFDTRFNCDIAEAFLKAYQIYNDKAFLKGAILFADFYLAYSEQNHYKVGDGILVCDYGNEIPHQKTHVSLNHHLAGMNFLFELYEIIKEEKYLLRANEMLRGIRNTRDEWVMEDYNLKYALYDEGVSNNMVDYPYLTYNDLFITNEITKQYFGYEDPAIVFLMKEKRFWMEQNYVKGFREE